MNPSRLFTLRLATVVSFSLFVTQVNSDENTPAKLTKDQELVVAAFELDVAKVTALLNEGVDPNSRLGLVDGQLFEDKWTLGTPLFTRKWTPLFAVAQSHREPQPKERAVNTTEGLEEARNKLASVDAKLIFERDTRRVAIAKLLIAAKADLNLDDGFGATALYESIYKGFDELSLLLIASGAKLDTKTGVYIDGDGDITPLHRATKSPPVLAAMLKRGASVNVKDSSGDTPLHWAARDSNVASVKLLLEAGADANAKDDGGRTPSYWSRPYHKSEYRDAAAKSIDELLSKPRSGTDR